MPSTTRDRRTEEQFLRFHLIPDTNVMLPVRHLMEVLNIPLGQIMPIPQMPSWVMGVYNWRGEVLWMVDLGALVGLTPTHQQGLAVSSHRAVVLHPGYSDAHSSRNQMLGLVVSRVEDIEWCNRDEIQSPPATAVTSALAPFLQGYWLKTNGDMIIALNGDSILAAMPKS
jgi:positive phototaxis protein PixI